MRHPRVWFAAAPPGGPSGQTLPAIGPAASGHRETRERTDAAWRADWRTLLKVQRLLGAPHPRIRGEGRKSKDGRLPTPKQTTGADPARRFSRLSSALPTCRPRA